MLNQDFFPAAILKYGQYSLPGQKQNYTFMLQNIMKLVSCVFKFEGHFSVFLRTNTLTISKHDFPRSMEEIQRRLYSVSSANTPTTSNINPWLDKTNWMKVLYFAKDLAALICRRWTFLRTRLKQRQYFTAHGHTKCAPNQWKRISLYYWKNRFLKVLESGGKPLANFYVCTSCSPGFTTAKVVAVSRKHPTTFGLTLSSLKASPGC